MLERNFFTQDELALYDWRYSNYSFEQFYDELVRLGARTKRRKRDDDDYDSNPNRFLCDKVWNKRSNRQQKNLRKMKIKVKTFFDNLYIYYNKQLVTAVSFHVP